MWKGWVPENPRGLYNVNLPVALVEPEGIGEHGLLEPHPTEGVKESFVEVVSHSTTVLHLSQHVTHRRPRDA